MIPQSLRLISNALVISKFIKLMFIHFFKYEMDNQDIIQNIILSIDSIDDLINL
jgi:hypothetical protein